MRRSLIISGVGHVVLVAWGIVAFAALPSDAPPVESLPVEFISATDYTQLTHGVKNAPKLIDQAKPLADKVGETKPVKQLVHKVADRQDVTTDAAPQNPTPPKPEAKSEPKPAEKADKPKEKAKSDQIADELKKEETKKPPKKPPDFKPDQIAEELKKDDPKKQRPAPKFDADQVAALLDKRDPQRATATAETVNNAASLGAPTGHAAQLSVSEIDALRRRLSECWNPPPGIDVNSNLYVVLRVQFKSDASLAGDPVVVEDSASAQGPALAESGKRALLACQPFTMLRPEHYEIWKDISVKFNPHELLGE